MRKVSLFLVLLLALGGTAFSDDSDSEKTYYRGWVKEKRTDKMYNAVRIKPGRCSKEYFEFRFWYNGDVSQVKYEKIKSLEWFSKLKKAHDGMGSLIKMILRDGNEYKIHANMPPVCLTVIDSFSKGPKDKGINWKDVRSINFLEQLGGIKRCEKDGKEFHPHYIYCPYDGSELKYVDWKE